MIYRRVSDVKKPKLFSSGVVKDYRMDYVGRRGRGQDQGQRPSQRRLPGRGGDSAGGCWACSRGRASSVAGDFGVTHGGPDGGRTRLRTYWNNQHTGIVDDVVFELQMEPKNWGVLEFKP